MCLQRSGWQTARRLSSANIPKVHQSPFAAQVLQALLHQALTEKEILKIVTLELPGSREKCRQITRPVLPAKRPLKYIVFEEPYVDTGLTPESVSFLVTPL